MAYGAPFWVFGGLWLLLRFQQADLSPRWFRRAVILTIALELILVTGFLIQFYEGKQVRYVYYPTRELGTTCEQIWHEHVSESCPYIGGTDNDLIGLAACTMTTRPTVLVSYGSWAEDADLNQNGGLLIWERSNGNDTIPESLLKRFPQAVVLPDRPEIPYKIGSEIQTLNIGIAIVKKQK